MAMPLNKISWQDKRIKAMDRTIFRKKFTHEYLVDEYCAIINSKAKNKKQYKGEKNAETIFRK
jgi:hypothetical protein